MGSIFSSSKSTVNNEDGSSAQIFHKDPAIVPILQKWQQEQDDLKKKLLVDDIHEWNLEGETPKGLNYIGGVDISFVKGDDVNACAAYVILSYPSLEIVYKDLKMIQLTAPYVAGFLAFRETPSLVEMIERQRKENLDVTPDIILVDGNGILHPKRFGLACHLGVLIDIPCLGVAKTLFHVGGIENNKEHKTKIENLEKGGDTFPLITDSGEILGMALRSMDSTRNPVYVSAGHKVSLKTAVIIVHKCCKYRVPEPTRQADILSREYLQKNFKPSTQSE